MYGEESGRGRWKGGERGEGSEERWYREGRKRKGREGWCGEGEVVWSKVEVMRRGKGRYRERGGRERRVRRKRREERVDERKAGGRGGEGSRGRG